MKSRTTRPGWMLHAAASEAGFASGLARRKPSTGELAAFHRAKLWNTFARARRRGLEAKARLDQIELAGIQ